VNALLLTALALTLGAGDATSDQLQYLGPKPKAQVQRVVTLVPSITEIVISVGGGERLVGVSRFDSLPLVKDLPRVGGFVDPSVEAVLALRPDLVLVQPGPGNRGPVMKLAELGVPVLVLPLQSVADVLRAIREVGRALGRAEQGERVARELEAVRAQVRAEAKQHKPKKVLVVYGFSPLVVAGPGAFVDELLRDAGAKNAAGDAKAPYPVYSAESALRAKPEVVIDAVMGHESGGDRLRSLPGLREARWITVPSEDLLHPGPNIGRGLRALFEMIHGAPDGGPGR